MRPPPRAAILPVGGVPDAGAAETPGRGGIRPGGASPSAATADGVELAKDNWINGGWTVRSGRGSAWRSANANDIAERTLKYGPAAGPSRRSSSRRAATASARSRRRQATASLTTAADRELQGDFLSSPSEPTRSSGDRRGRDRLRRASSSPASSRGCVRQTEGLSAAARLPARYVEDLENEAEAADTAVAMRKEVPRRAQAQPVDERAESARQGRPRRRASGARGDRARAGAGRGRARRRPRRPATLGRAEQLSAQAAARRRSGAEGERRRARRERGGNGGARWRRRRRRRSSRWSSGSWRRRRRRRPRRPPSSSSRRRSTSSRRRGTPPRRCEPRAILAQFGAILAEFGAIIPQLGAML